MHVLWYIGVFLLSNRRRRVILLHVSAITQRAVPSVESRIASRVPFASISRFSCRKNAHLSGKLPLLSRLYKINYGLPFLLKLCKASSANSFALLFICPSFFGRRLL